jgi:hypothetical protein
MMCWLLRPGDTTDFLSRSNPATHTDPLKTERVSTGLIGYVRAIFNPGIL